MTDPSTVFDHPEVRSRRAHPDVADRISLRDHIGSVEIGAFEVERDVTQRLAFNVVVEVAQPPGPLDDNVDLILSYDSLTDAIATELAAERVNLLETLAERIAARILIEPAAQRIYLRIEKLDRGAGKLGVEIMRDSPKVLDDTVDVDLGDTIHVGILPEGGDVTGWAAWAMRQKQPLILVSAQAPASLPRNMPPKAAQRAVLLDLDRIAWLASSQSEAVSVVASQTEMMWGLAQGQVNLWAPTKMVLSHLEAQQAIDVATLASWLAEYLGGKVVFLASTPPADEGSV